MDPHTIRIWCNYLLDFTFFYPLFMAYVWMIGAINYYLRFERKVVLEDLPPGNPFLEPVSLVIPMYNEVANARETIEHALAIDYPSFEIIAVNDGSTDGTAELIDELARGDERLRVVHLAANQGKAI